MRKIKIITDSTCDLSSELINRYDIGTVPICVNLGEKEFKDGVDIVPSDITAYVDSTKQLPKTAAPSVFDFENIFKTWLDQDYDIFYTGLGSNLSSSYSSAVLASKSLSEDRIRIVDSCNLSTGTGLLVCKAGDMMKAGCSLAEIEQEISNTVPKVRAGFIVDSIDYLYMGGRCSAMASFAAGILKLRPRLAVKDGLIVSDKKYRGNFDRCLDEYISDIVGAMTNVDNTRVFVTNAYSPIEGLNDGDCEKCFAVLKASTDFKEYCYTHAGCVVFSHCGPRTIGILYIDK